MIFELGRGLDMATCVPGDLCSVDINSAVSVCGGPLSLFFLIFKLKQFILCLLYKIIFFILEL